MRSPLVVVLIVLAALAAVFLVSGGDPLSLFGGGGREHADQGAEDPLGAADGAEEGASQGTRARGPRLEGLELVRRQGQGALRGRVLDARTGKGVAEATLLLTGKGHGDAVVAMNVESAADGGFSLLEVPSGDAYALRVEAPGVGARNLTGLAVAAGGVNDLGDLWLGHVGTIEGVVVDAAGEPVARAEVQLHRGASTMREFLMSGGFVDLFRNIHRAPEPQAQQESGPRGEFRFEGVSPGSHSVLVRAPAYRQAIVTATLAGDGGTERLTVRLATGGTIAGQVVDASGRGLGDVTVAALSQDGGMPTPLARTFTTTGPDGAFRFETLVGDGEHMLVAGASGWPQTFAKADAGDAAVRLVMKRGATLELVLLVDEGGAPIEGAEVLAAVGDTDKMSEGPDTLVGGVTDATGTALLEVRPGVLQMLLVTHRDRPSTFWAAQQGAVSPGMLKAPQDLKVREGRTRLVFRAPTGVTIVGRVLDPEGNALAGAEISTLSFMGSPSKAISGSDGSFRLAADPMMAAALQVRLPGWVQERSEPVGGEEATPAGGEKRIDIRMRRAAAVSGRVLTPDGQPLAGATVVARLVRKEGEQPFFDASEMFGGAPSSLTLGDGSYVIEGVPAGKQVRVVARREGYVDAATEPFRTGNDGLASAPDLRLLAGVALRVRVLGHDGDPVAGARVRLEVDRKDGVESNDFESLMEDVSGKDDVRTGAGGEVVVPLVPPGTLTLRVSASGHAPGGTSLEVGTAGGPGEPVVVRLPPGQTLSGHVLDTDGAPLEGVWVQVLDAPDPSATPNPGDNEWDRARRATTDAQGAWRVPDLPQRALRVRARKDGYRALTQDVGALREGIELRLAAQTGDATARIAEIDQELMALYGRLREQGTDRAALMQQIQALQQERTSLVGDEGG